MSAQMPILHAQTNAGTAPDSTPYVQTEIGPNHCVWSKAVPAGTNEYGDALYQTNSYTQLETGGWYFDQSSGGWLPSQEVIQVTPQGGAARQGSYQMTFAGNINAGSSAAINLTSPDGKTLAMAPLGISYADASTGSNVWIALIQDSQGYILPSSNQVVWPNAYSGLKCDLRWTYTKSAAEEDIILRQRPPDPATYGMNPANVKIQAWCEFIGPNAPEIRRTGSGNDTDDELLSWGVVQIPQGKAFLLEDELALTPVKKHWLQIEGRTFLVEEVDFSSVAAQLQTLPESASAGSNNGPGQALLHRISPRPILPARLSAKKIGGSLKLAKTFPKEKGFVLDYIILTSQANATLKADTTYYVSGAVSLSGTTTLEAAVIKFAPTGSPAVTCTGPLNCLCSLYRTAIFTARDDDSVGAKITGSTGTPTNNNYAVIALNLNTGTNVTLQYLRICNAQSAVAINGNTNHVFSHLQLVNCQNGFNATNADYSLRNALLWNVLTNFTGSSSTGRVEHLTVDTANWLNNNQTIYLTNCLLVSVTNAGSFTSNTVYNLSSATGIFQTVWAGNHYLATGSPYRDAGTTNINPALATALGQMTTWPPLVLTNTITVNTVLQPQAQRDSGNGAYDIGWHYAPLDYGFSNTVLQASLTLSNGVAVGLRGTYGLDIQTSAQFNSQGLPQQLNRLASYQDVQEQALELGGNKFFQLETNYSPSLLFFRFTDMTIGQGSVGTLISASPPSLTYTNLVVQDCSLRETSITLSDNSPAGENFVIFSGLTNNVLERCTVSFVHGSPGTFYYNDSNVNLGNNLFWRGTLTLTYYNENFDNVWQAYDNLFDGASVTLTGTGTTNHFYRGNNGFTAGTSNPFGSGITGLQPDYQVGPFGNYYYPTNGTNLFLLINAGSQTADLAGLYHYTTTTNQVPETNSIVDIGFHYVAVGTNGLPLDTDGDGVPDYLEDANGNGKVDSGETSWTNSTDLGLKVLITRPKNNSVIP